MAHNMTEICERLQCSERRVKITALEEFQRFCEDSQNNSVAVLAAFDECYLYLLKCYADRFESVRDLAVRTVTSTMACLPPTDFHLSNIISTLNERMGQQETLEESEEIRLIYVIQLNSLVNQFVEARNVLALQESYAEIVRILVKALRDPYPAVKREACECIVTLATSADTYYFQQWAEQLAKALYGALNHKHSQMRIAAVTALARVSLHVNASGEELSRLIMEVSPLLMDSMPLVRRECGQLGILLLLELRDRYSYFDRVLPLVLCCLKDDSPEVVNYIQPLWVKCGQQFYEENETELNKQELADLQSENYPVGVQRPTIGCRGIVQRSLRLLKLITRESADWKENVRLHSLKLLYQFVLHAEAAMTAKFFEIYPEVARACRDQESFVANEAIKVADLMGRLFTYEDWREHGFEGFVKGANEGYLKCFYYMFTAAAGVEMVDVLKIAELLSTPEYSQTLKPEIQLYVLKMVETLLEKAERHNFEKKEDNEEKDYLYKRLYIASIKVMALSFDSGTKKAGQIQEKAQHILTKIAEKQFSSVSEIHEKYFALVLAHVENLDAQLDELSEPILLLHGLLSICKLRHTYLEPLQLKINLVWLHCADEAKVRIFTAISIAMLSWQETIGVGPDSFDKSTELLNNFCNQIVEPHLQWQAGANAESMRCLATATLCAMSQGAPKESLIVLPVIAHKYMPSLLEDRCTATRLYAVKCMLHFGSLKIEDMKPIAYAVLQRLDDPSANIRELAVTAIPRLCPKFEKQKGEEGDYEYDIWETFIRSTFNMLFLHYEAPEVRLKTAIKDTIIELAKSYPELCKSCYQRVLTTAYISTGLKDLEAELPFYFN